MAVTVAPAEPQAVGKQSGYIRTLDGWRAIAVALVILGHLAQTNCRQNGASNWCAHTDLGSHGVAIFFALSGFLITRRLEEERQLRGHVSLSDFYVRRAFRILPAAILYLLAVAALGVVGRIHVGVGAWLGSLLFVRDYAGAGPAEWYTGHFWSLAVEEKFYLFWPAIFVGVRRNRLVWVSVAIALAVALWRVVDGHWHVMLNQFDVPFSLEYRWDTRLDALMWGCILALLWVRPSAHGRLHILRSAPVAVSVLVVFVMTILAKTNHPRDSLFLETIVAPLLIVSTAISPQTIVGRLFESPVFRWIGLRSYGIYLWQQLFLARQSHDLGPLQDFPISIIAILACAAVSYQLVERPLIRLGHRLARPATPGRSDAR